VFYLTLYLIYNIKIKNGEVLKMKNKKKGFTLVELLVVIAIIGILAAVIAPNALKAIEKSKVSAAISDYKAFKTAALNYYADTGKWPAGTTNGAGTFLTDTNPSTTGWNGPYLEKWPSKNPWGGTYEYKNDDKVDWDSTTGGDIARYLQLTNVPSDAATRLQTELGKDVVQQDKTSTTTVYLLISK